MPELTGQGFVTKDPGAYDYALVGTAAGTTVLRASPCFLYGVNIPTRVANGTIILYDSASTNTVPIGTISLGTQTFSDPPPTYEFHAALKNGLTVSNSANLGATVMYK